MWRIEINFASADKLSILFFVDFYIRTIYKILLLLTIFSVMYVSILLLKNLDYWGLTFVLTYFVSQ